MKPARHFLPLFLQHGLWLLLLCQASLLVAAQPTLPPVAKPFTAYNFTVSDIDGKQYRLSDYRGKVVVLNFWATWCPPCREEMPSMNRAHKKLINDNVVILAVNVGEDEDTIFEFTGNYPVEFPLLMDKNGDVIKRYPVMGLPTTYIISQDGIVTHRTVGGRAWDDNQLLDELRRMQKKIPLNSGLLNGVSDKCISFSFVTYYIYSFYSAPMSFIKRLYCGSDANIF